MKITPESRLVMGIVNITPDSFYSSSASLREKDILQKVEKHILEGADIIDIGAQSTRPHSELISAEEELQRILTPLKIIRKTFPKTYISIDTFYSKVAKECIEQGINMINDISGGNIDNHLISVIAQYPQIEYLLMHMQGMPHTMQQNPHYKNVVDEVYHFFENKLQSWQHIKNNIILDVGFGFGKTIEHNYQLLKNLSHFKSFHKPLLVGVSRKGMITKLLHIHATDALNGTTAVNMLALVRGANILRVHDVKEAKECIQIFEQL